MARTCERCGRKASAGYELFDYCGVCSKNLCESCMVDGCCGHKPALSGAEADYSDHNT